MDLTSWHGLHKRDPMAASVGTKQRRVRSGELREAPEGQIDETGPEMRFLRQRDGYSTIKV